MTVCTKCLIDKDDSEFRKRPDRPKGITSQCKLCCAAGMRKTWAKHRDKYAVTMKKWREANPDKVAAGRQRRGPENKEKRKASRAAHEERNPGTQAAKARRKRARNPATNALATKKWRTANPDKIRVYASHRRAATKRAIPQWEADAQRREYAWRRANPGMTLDHVVPISSPLAISLGARPASKRERNLFVGPLIPLVYGFHTEANWAPLPYIENIKKGNRDWPNSPWS